MCCLPSKGPNGSVDLPFLPCVDGSPFTQRIRLQEVVSDFDTHHIGVQQPLASAQDETDTHLHNQPVPDVTSQQSAHTLAATQDVAPHTSSSQQAPMQPHASNPGAGHDQSAAQPAQPQAHVSGLLPSHSQQQHDQSGVAVFLQSQAGQLSSSS